MGKQKQHKKFVRYRASMFPSPLLCGLGTPAKGKDATDRNRWGRGWATPKRTGRGWRWRRLRWGQQRWEAARLCLLIALRHQEQAVI